MIFEVTDEQIERLNATDLRTLVGLLCEEKVRLQGHSPVSVTRGGNQKASDGGFDVRVSLHENAAIAGYGPIPDWTSPTFIDKNQLPVRSCSNASGLSWSR